MLLFSRLIITGFCFIASVQSIAQSKTISISEAEETIIQMDKMNVGFLFLENPFSVYSEYEIEEIDVTAIGGVLKQVEGNKFSIYSDSLRTTTIQVRRKTTNGQGVLIAEQKIRFKQIPNPYGSVGGKYSLDKTITTAKLQTAVGMRGVMINFDYDMTFSINSFRCEVIFESGMYRDLGVSNGNQFSTTMKAAFNQPIKRVIFSEITCQMPGGIRTISPIVLDVN